MILLRCSFEEWKKILERAGEDIKTHHDFMIHQSDGFEQFAGGHTEPFETCEFETCKFFGLMKNSAVTGHSSERSKS